MIARRLAVCGLLLMLAGTTPSLAAAQPARDAAKPAPTGTATAAGTIVVDEAESRPLRRVRVGLMGSDRQVARTAITDDAGRFSFTALPAGRYMLTASRQGYVTAAYGAKRPNRPGSALVLADGQRLTGLQLRMTRGGVISGVLVDQNGEPYSGANVSAMRPAFVGTGQRTLVPAASAQTDNRGRSRIWGLAAGDYLVSASPGFLSPVRADTDIARLTDADIKRALAEVEAGASRPGARGASSSTPDAVARARTVGYASVFYPGTSVASQAIPVKLGAAEERTGVDFPLSLVPTARVEGTVVVPDGMTPQTLGIQMVGSNPQGMLLEMFRRATPSADGSFTFPGVAPGPYAIVVQAQQPGGPGGRPPAPAAAPRAPTHWARADVTVDGQDISGVTLTLQPGMVVSGRIQFEGTTAPPPDLSRIRINLLPVQAQGEISLGQMQIQPDAGGAFSIAGVAPGRYRLIGSIPSPRPDANAWQLKSSAIHGRDTLDAPIDLREGADNAVITFTDRLTELNGSVQDASGQPAPEYHVVVFARDKAYWSAQSRRIRSVRPGADGKYTMPNLPPGEYPDDRRHRHGTRRAVRPGGPGAPGAVRDRAHPRRRREENPGPAPHRSAAVMGGDEPVVAAGIEHTAFAVAVWLIRRRIN